MPIEDGYRDAIANLNQSYDEKRAAAINAVEVIEGKEKRYDIQKIRLLYTLAGSYLYVVSTQTIAQQALEHDILIGDWPKIVSVAADRARKASASSEYQLHSVREVGYMLIGHEDAANLIMPLNYQSETVNLMDQSEQILWPVIHDASRFIKSKANNVIIPFLNNPQWAIFQHLVKNFHRRLVSKEELKTVINSHIREGSKKKDFDWRTPISNHLFILRDKLQNMAHPASISKHSRIGFELEI